MSLEPSPLVVLLVGGVTLALRGQGKPHWPPQGASPCVSRERRPPLGDAVTAKHLLHHHLLGELKANVQGEAWLPKEVALGPQASHALPKQV